MSAYVIVGSVTLAGVLLFVLAMAARSLVAPRVGRPATLTTYESGVDPIGQGWAQTNVRYFVYAFLYVIFAVDAVYLFPWATIFAAPGYGVTTLVEMFVFIGFLAVGLLYAWRKGVLTWS